MRRSRRRPRPGRQRVRVDGEPSGGPLCWVEAREAPGSKDPAIWLEPHQPFWVRADRSGACTRIHAVRVRREQRAPVRLGSMSSQAQLLIYGFEPGAEFEGRMVGAIERIESGRTLRVLDVVFVMRDPETAELVAIEQHRQLARPDVRAGGGDGIRVHSVVGVIPTQLWIVLFFVAGVLFAFMLFFADRGERAFVQGMLIGSVIAVIAALLLLLRALDEPFHDGVGGLQPSAMQRSLRMADDALKAA